MSNKTQNAKKPKTTSALSGGLTNLAYLAIGSLVLWSLFIMLKGQPKADGEACFNNSCISLEYASTPVQRARGLSGRTGLPDDSGMLFVFDAPARDCMWMKDMRFNLDIIWLDKNKKVVSIARNLTPASFPQSFCVDDTKYVLEINPGKAAQLGLNIGDLVRL